VEEVVAYFKMSQSWHETKEMCIVAGDTSNVVSLGFMKLHPGMTG